MPCTAMELGAYLWGGPDRDRDPRTVVRPATRLIHRMYHLHWIEEQMRHHSNLIEWKPTELGLQEYQLYQKWLRGKR